MPAQCPLIWKKYLVEIGKISLSHVYSRVIPFRREHDVRIRVHTTITGGGRRCGVIGVIGDETFKNEDEMMMITWSIGRAEWNGGSLSLEV